MGFLREHRVDGDIVAFRGDPSRHIISLAGIKHTSINGKVVYSSKD
jgi:imidazolonepropionase-like amidohydrolase